MTDDRLNVSQEHFEVRIGNLKCYAQGQIGAIIPRGAIRLYGRTTMVRLEHIEGFLTDEEWLSVQGQCETQQNS